MQKSRSTLITDRLVRILPKHVAVSVAEQLYRSKIEVLLQELHILLPRYWNSVDPGQYAYDRDEVMALTAAYQDSSLSLIGLEALVGDVMKHRQTFAHTLGRPTPAA